MELNSATARLLELVRDNTECTGAMLLSHLAQELSMPEETVTGFGSELLAQLNDQSIIVSRPSS